MRQVILYAVVLFSLGGLGNEACLASQSAEPVCLNRSLNWLMFPDSAGGARPVARELVRQAFLIAARDEMGLSTRDAWLGDAMPTTGDKPSWDVVAALREPITVEIVRALPENQINRISFELPRSVRKRHNIDYIKLTELTELLSRTKFVEGLRQAGYQGKPNPRHESLALPEKIETLLGEMNFVSQFQAVHELHTLIHRRGESSALLGGLSRGYANLGVMTEYYWHPAHKVFKARAVLYAQRMVARDPHAPLALWHRAYAGALSGGHVWAEKDLERAEKAYQSLAEKNRLKRPAWAGLIGPFVRYDIPALEKCAGDPKVKDLARLLKFLAIYQAGGQMWVVQNAVETFKALPECYCVNDAACAFGGVSLLHSATMTPLKTVGETLYRRLGSMPDLPSEARAIVKKKTLGGGWLSALLGEGQAGPADEFKIRGQLIRALLQSGTPVATKTVQDDRASKEKKEKNAQLKAGVEQTAVADQKGGDKKPQTSVHSAAPPALVYAEPTWATLGLLIRELSFLQVVRRAAFERSYLGMPPDDWLQTAEPLVQGHPYHTYLETFVWDASKRAAAAARLAKMPTPGADCTCYNMYCAMDPKNSSRLEFYYETFRNADPLVRDFVVMIRLYSHGDETFRKFLGENLLEVSPHSPLARSTLIEADWDGIQAKLKQWDRMAARYPAIAWSLAVRYLQAGRWDDAERCYRAALKLVPSDPQLYQQLAGLYLKQGKTDRWLATLKEYLDQPDFGLGHFQVQADIAHHFMSEKKWSEALAYAEGAAEAYSAWGLLCAARCHEALQHWDKAEEYYRDCSQRYDDNRFSWYFFCRRTGEGDLEQSRQFARATIEKLPALKDQVAPYDLMAFYALEDQPAKALAELEKIQTRYAGDAIWAALLADQIKDAKKRDAALNRARMLVAPTGDGLSNTPNGVLILADLLSKDLAQGGKAQIDTEAADQLAARLSVADRFSFQYAVGRYLTLHGNSKAADRYWMQCMGYPRIDARYRTLAGAELVKHGRKPSEYRPLLQAEAAESAKAKPHGSPAGAAATAPAQAEKPKAVPPRKPVVTPAQP